MWKELTGRLYPDAEFAAPASDAEIDRIERRLGQAVPEDLRELLRQSDGVRAEYGSGLVWSVREIIEENTEFRSNADFAELYRPFDRLMLIGDNGGGDRFGYARGPAERPDVFAWDHETDERTCVARSLQDYLECRAGSDGDDWYK
ncbi:SMI1/KNR4 family protein [Allonocardiopsis opalescens]|uniref:SUKH superfamily protein n=1 Tax=Allonocardiopsis opalescens TaxID=1144618 RepID=A0A2T0QA87_9ACTN|nr:SMI1/KNR4 family protein [Allonocardiopsis opalescens]PRY00826.1 SUKH superfamily protein [Allonocardiopsis opalescens]